MMRRSWNELRSPAGPLPVALFLGAAIVAMMAGASFAANYFGTSDSTITSIDGHDRAGTTTNRPSNMSVGMLYFNQTTMRMEVANGTSLNHIASVPDSTTAGAAGLANGVSSGSGAAATGTTAGGAGGSYTLLTGVGGAKTTTGAAAGGAGGALVVTVGNGGNTASSGSDAGGAGGGATITTGNGGNATAGTGNGGAAGNLNLVLGTGGTSAGGAAGANGQIQVNGTAGLMTMSFVYGEATPIDAAFGVCIRPYRVLGITVRPLVVGSDGSAVTLQVRKAASGTALASGTVLHSGSADLKGTINTNQVLTLSTTSTDLDVAAGTAIGIDVTGTTTAARGVVSVLLGPQ